MSNHIIERYTHENYACIRSFWRFNFYKPSLGDIKAIEHLPEETTRLIMTVGLPKDMTRLLALSFDPFAEQFAVSIHWNEQYVVLGQFLSKGTPHGVLFALHVASGDIYRLWPELEAKDEAMGTNKLVQFINSSLEKFLICCTIYERYIPSLKELAAKRDNDDLFASLSEEESFAVTDCIYEEMESVIQVIRSEISEIDQRAFEKVDMAYFWPSLIYEWNM